MKKTMLFLLTLIGILLISCNSIDSQISKYEKACEKGDYVKAMKIAEEIEKHSEELTSEQTMRILNASTQLAEKVDRDAYESDEEYHEDAYESATSSWTDLEEDDDDDDDDF